MSVGGMCALAEVSRTGYYRFLTTPAAGDKDIDLRDAIQRIALSLPATADRASRPNYTAEAGKSARTGYTGSCERTTCCACGGAHS